VPDELPPDEDPDDEHVDDAADEDAAEDDEELELDESTRAALRAALAAVTSQGEMLRRVTGHFTEQINAITELGRVAQNAVAAGGVQEAMKAFRVKLPAFEFPELQALQTQIAQVFAGVDWSAIQQGIQQAYRRGVPPNWRDLGDDLKLWPLVELCEAGYPTAWVPRASVLQELIDANEPDRGAVFAARRVEIIEDCCACLEEVTSGELVDITVMLGEALELAETGRHLVAAQALAACVFDTILRRNIKPQSVAGYYRDAKKEINDRHENASLDKLRWGVVHVPAIVALAKFDAPNGDPVPTIFNRHASAHAVGPEQYTEANAVIALALATSLVREAHQKIVDDAAGASSTP
jgi:hypothetical protein